MFERKLGSESHVTVKERLGIRWMVEKAIAEISGVTSDGSGRDEKGLR